MPYSLGKMFETKFKEDWIRTFPDSFILRLYDTTNGFQNIGNPSDFICYNKGLLFLAEVKSVQSASFPFTNLRQYDRLLTYSHKQGVRPVVIIWFTKHNQVLAVPIVTIKKMKRDGLKSINPEKIERDKYFVVEVPSVKLRTFMKSDYSVLMTIPEDVDIEKIMNEEVNG